LENTFKESELARYGLLDSAIKARIMGELVNNNVEINKQIAKKLKEQLIKKFGLKNTNEKDLWLKKRNLKEEDLEYMSQLNFKWRMFCKDKFKSNLKSIFLKRKDEFDTVTYSLLRVDNQNLIRELYQQIYEKEFTFLEIASQYSDGPEKRTGGLIGPVPMNNPHPFLVELLRVSSPGQLSPPIKFDKWWILIRLEELQSAKFDENIKDKLALIEGENLLRKKLNDKFK
tara:strand:- start:534 stop:1220 length:687 start_codon:yes stop_codon:yes gene_type:complete